MSYSLYSTSGWIGSLASISGLKDLKQAIPNTFQQLHALFDNGYTSNLAGVTQELTLWLKTPALAADVRSTAENLKKLLPKCEEVAIISDSYSETVQ